MMLIIVAGRSALADPRAGLRTRVTVLPRTALATRILPLQREPKEDEVIL